MSRYITSEQFEGGIASIRQDIRDFIQHFNKTLGTQDEKINEVTDDIRKVKAAVIDLLGTDRYLRNLVSELHAHNVPVDDRKIFS